MKRFWTSDRKLLLLLLGVPLLVLVLLIIYPLIYSFQLSFYDYKILSGLPPKWIGTDNYLQICQDSTIAASIKVTAEFLFWSVLIEMLLGFLLAYLVYKPFRGAALVKIIFLLPYVIPAVVVGTIWKWMLNPDFGFQRMLNEITGNAGFSLLGSPDYALWGLIISDIWHMTPLVILLLMAGLQSISDDMFEAARIDGAGRLQSFWYLTLPIMKRMLVVVGTFRLLTALKTFDKVVSLTQGGPGLSTQILSYSIYLNGFKNFDFGYTSAISYFLLAIVVVFACAYTAVLRRGES